MCNPRRVEVTVTRSIAEAWEREVRRTASRSAEVRGEVRLRQSLEGSLGGPAAAALDRLLDAGVLGWTTVGDAYRFDVQGGYAMYSPADRSLTIVAVQSDVVEGRGQARAVLSGRVEDEMSATGVGVFYDDEYQHVTPEVARQQAEGRAAAAIDQAIRQRLDQEMRDAEAARAESLERAAESAAEEDLSARRATRQAELQREVEGRAAIVGLEARRAFHSLLARAYRDALLALARHRGAEGVSCREDGDVLEIEFVLPS